MALPDSKLVLLSGFYISARAFFSFATDFMQSFFQAISKGIEYI
jgi:hypothetical protein